MISRLTIFGAVLALMLGAAPPARAQDQGAKPDMSGMKGMDMDAMMKQCAQMRQQMKPGAAMSPDMQKMMTQCDEMDRSMNSSSQPYTPPAHRTR